MNHEGKEHAGLSQTFLAEEEVCAVLVLVLRVNTPDSSSLFQMTRVVWMFAEPHHWSVCRVQGAVGDTGECSVVPRQPVLGKPGASAGDSSGAKLVSPSCVKLSRVGYSLFLLPQHVLGLKCCAMLGFFSKIQVGSFNSFSAMTTYAKLSTAHLSHVSY